MEKIKKIILAIIIMSSNNTFGQGGKFWDKINKGIDNLDSKLLDKLGYFQTKGKWEYFGGGSWDRFGHLRSEIVKSPFNKHFKATLQANVDYNLIVKSPNQKGFGFIIYDQYGQEVITKILQHQTGVLNEIFQVRNTGPHDIFVFTSRGEVDVLNDQNGIYEMSINSKNIYEIVYPKHLLENENFDELGGGGIGNGINALGGTVDTHIFSPRNKNYEIDIESESNLHVIAETFNISTLVTIVDPFGNLVGYGDNEARCEVKKGGKYKITVSTRDKDKSGKFNIYFSGKFTKPPTKINYKQYSKIVDTKEGDIFKVQIFPKENSVIDFKITSPNNSCKLDITNSEGISIQNLPNPWEQSVVLNNKDKYWDVKINCSRSSSNKTTFYIFGDFNLLNESSNLKNDSEITFNQNFDKQISKSLEDSPSNENVNDIEDLIFDANKNPTFENLYGLGKAYWKIENFESTIFNLERAYKINSEDLKLNYFLGKVYFSKASNDEVNDAEFKNYLNLATKYFEKAHKIKPIDCIVVSALNMCYNIQNINKKVSCKNDITHDKKLEIKGKLKAGEVSGNTTVYAIDLLTNDKFNGTINLNDKTFFIEIIDEKDYIVYIEENGKLGNSVKFNKGGNVIINDLELISYKSGNKISFRNINFQSGKAVLLPESYQELDKVANFLLDQKNVKIEIIGHTDDVGGENDNLLLSKERAESVSFYLISKGIPKNAFKVLGMGKSSPLIRSIDENSRYLNRRVELKIL
jgi:outer membrane protein OmpA-like peptidoglycan-associated protein